MAKRKKLAPLKIKCTDTDCKSGLHCFKPTKEVIKDDREGNCRTCDADLIDWNRIKSRNISDVDYTFVALKMEYIRDHFFKKEIDQKAENHARRKGRKNLELDIDKRVEVALAPSEPFRDGFQTPMENNSIYYAQHATACCCRKCVEYWHGIPTGRDLTENEKIYLSGLMKQYLKLKLPNLTEGGEKVPPIRTKK